jgi:hypothetical protein
MRKIINEQTSRSGGFLEGRVTPGNGVVVLRYARG